MHHSKQEDPSAGGTGTETVSSGLSLGRCSTHVARTRAKGAGGQVWNGDHQPATCPGVRAPEPDITSYSQQSVTDTDDPRQETTSLLQQRTNHRVGSASPAHWGVAPLQFPGEGLGQLHSVHTSPTEHEEHGEASSEKRRECHGSLRASSGNKQKNPQGNSEIQPGLPVVWLLSLEETQEPPGPGIP